MPLIGAYWLRPSFIARVSASRRFGGGSKSGKPCPRFTALCSSASWLITVKMVVPTLGNLVSICIGVRSGCGPGGMLARGFRSQGPAFAILVFAARRLGQTLGEEFDESANRRQEAAAARIDEVHHALWRAPFRQQHLQLAA